MNMRQSAHRWALCCMVTGLFLGPTHALDHSHVQLLLEVGAADASASGDALGVYAAQLLPCEAAATSGLLGQPDPWRIAAERLLGLLVGTAHANHRERFDGPASGEFMKRVALDRAGMTPIGEIVAPAARYCGVQLTLARLPVVGAVSALPFSLRLSTAAGNQIQLDFRESLTVNFDKPWFANGRSARLVIVLHPRSAAALIAGTMDDFGATSQRVVAQLAKASSAHITTR